MRYKILIIVLMLLLPTLAFSQYDILSINLIDSLNTESDFVLAYDITGDGIDDIVVGDESQITIYDIITNEVIWQYNSFEGSVSSIEIADIEPDGDLDLMVGTLEPYYRHFYIVYDMDTENIYEWPEPMPGTCYGLHFQRIDGVPYVFMRAFGLLKMNLQDLTYNRLADYDLHYPIYFTDSLIYGTYHLEDNDGDHRYAYAMDFDFNGQIYQRLISCDMYRYAYFPRAYADFTDSPGIEFIHAADCVLDEETPVLNLHICNSGLEEIECINYNWIYSAGYLLAGNFANDEYSEILIRCTTANDPSIPVNILFSGKGEILAITQVGESISPKLTCNLDNDPFDEIMVVGRTIIYLYDIEVITVDVDKPTSLPANISVLAYPNPFNASTTISYDLLVQAEVSLEIYDILGRKIETLVNGSQPAGHHQVLWQADDVPSGVYFYKLTTGEHTQTEKMVLMK